MRMQWDHYSSVFVEDAITEWEGNEPLRILALLQSIGERSTSTPSRKDGPTSRLNDTRNVNNQRYGVVHESTRG